MAKLNLSAILIAFTTLLIATQINVNHGRELLAEEEDELVVENICLKNQKLAKIHYYAAGAPNATVFEVARATISSNAWLSFGKILVVDDFITAVPGAGSEILGRAQGILTSADMNILAIAMNYNLVFTAGSYSRSTLSIAGRAQLSDPQSRLAVVGVFRYTRGHAAFTIHSTFVGNDSVVYTVEEYTIYATLC